VKKLLVLFFVSCVLTGCPQTEGTIESTICSIREANNSPRNIYIQYYYRTPLSGAVFLERIHLKPYSEYNDGHSNYDNCDPEINYGDSNYRYTPNYDNPVETIEKIVIIDVDSRRVAKKINKSELIVKLENAEDNYAMRCRFERYVVTITNEIFDEK
jgi:hypothetical protein